MRMTRYWMTGCMALILLGAGRWPVREESENAVLVERNWITLTSKYGLNETLRQVERSVRQKGLPVVARATPRLPAGHGAAAGEATVLVLGDEGGKTPVLHAGDRAAPELPWQVVVRERPGGGTEVLMADLRGIDPPEGVAPETLEKVTTLSQAVASAVT